MRGAAGAAPEAPLGIQALLGNRVVRHYDEFVANTGRYGLPVKFLRQVGRDYTIVRGDSSVVYPTLNIMALEESDLQSASQMAPALPVGEASALRTLYEEGTHAYLDLMASSPKFQPFIADGVRHYQGAPTTQGLATTSPSRVFQEAAGTYVGHRVSAWWMAFEKLSIHASKAKADPAYAARLQAMNMLEEIGADYNREMVRVEQNQRSPLSSSMTVLQ